MTVDELLQSAMSESEPPADLSEAGRALWYTRAGDWEAAHNIAQEIHTPIGSWIHAHLHVIEGDTGNARYWYGHASRPPRGLTDLDGEWREIASQVLAR